ncbi:MAG: hypothetical protein RLZZ01_261 [Actinomycetota bacterium]
MTDTTPILTPAEAAARNIGKWAQGLAQIIPDGNPEDIRRMVAGLAAEVARLAAEVG